MKNNILSSLVIVLSFIILLSCSESDNPIVSKKDNRADQSLSKTITEITYCGNLTYPGYYAPGAEGTDMVNPDIKNMTFFTCAREETNQTQRTIATYWYNLVAPNEKLNDKMCFDTIERSFSVTQSIINNHAKFSWNKMWSHFYVIKRKIGTGSWEPLKTISNADKSSLGNITTFEDNIDLTTQTSKIYYSVSTKIFDRYQETKYFEYGENVAENLITSITGTSTVILPSKGSLTTVTWSAQVNGGTPNYKYEWRYNGILVGTGSTFTKSYSYKGTNVNYWHRLDLKVTDVQGKTSSSSKSINIKTLSRPTRF